MYSTYVCIWLTRYSKIKNNTYSTFPAAKWSIFTCLLFGFEKYRLGYCSFSAFATKYTAFKRGTSITMKLKLSVKLTGFHLKYIWQRLFDLGEICASSKNLKHTWNGLHLDSPYLLDVRFWLKVFACQSLTSSNRKRTPWTWSSVICPSWIAAILILTGQVWWRCTGSVFFKFFFGSSLLVPNGFGKKKKTWTKIHKVQKSSGTCLVFLFFKLSVPPWTKSCPCEGLAPPQRARAWRRCWRAWRACSRTSERQAAMEKWCWKWIFCWLWT